MKLVWACPAKFMKVLKVLVPVGSDTGTLMFCLDFVGSYLSFLPVHVAEESIALCLVLLLLAFNLSYVPEPVVNRGNVQTHNPG